ncbi:MAG: copper chaperone PCu(A)C [Vicinamibacterales bacterium]
MKILRTSLLLLVAISAHLSAGQPAVSATDGWIAAPAAGATTAAAYVTIQNPTMYDIYVVSASAEVAGKIEFRDGDKPAKDLTVPSFGSLELKSGESSMVLMELKRPLQAGETIELTLRTDGGLSLKVAALVK